MFDRRRTQHIGPGGVVIGRDANAPISTTVLLSQDTPLTVAVQDLAVMAERTRRSEFTGREWIKERLRTFLDEHTHGYFLFEAEAGVGKSALACQLVHEHGYYGHFTQLASGKIGQVALTNLAAQLLLRLDLHQALKDRFEHAELDPATVPVWLTTPPGFARLLDVAAATGQRIVLVVDGLDEAVPDPEAELPLGLPRVLPRGVFVIATFRSGIRLDGIDAPSATTRLSAGDPRNLADLREHLEKIAEATDIAAVRAAQGVDRETFVSTVLEHSDGVWITMDAIVSNYRAGDLDLTDLASLPARLSGFYAVSFLHWRDSAHWSAEDLPLLGTLAVLEEPVRVAVLSDLSGVPADLVRQACDQRYRPFLDVTGRGSERTFSIKHRTLLEFIGGTLPAAPDTLPEDLVNLADELAEAVATAHNRIADFYLPLLRSSRIAQAHRGYGRRHLTTHLRHAGRHREAREVFTLPDRRTDGRDNVLLAVQTEAGDRNRFARELEQTRIVARSETDAAPDIRASTKSLAFEVHAALLTAAATAGYGQVPVRLTGALIQHGVWGAATALSLLGALHNRALRCRGLIAALPALSKGGAAEFLDLARDCLPEIGNPVDRILATAQLAAHTDVTGHLTEAVAMAEALPPATDTAHAWLALLPHLPADRRPAVFSAAVDQLRRERDDLTRGLGLAAAARHGAADDLCREALDTVSTVDRTRVATVAVELVSEALRTDLVALLANAEDTLDHHHFRAALAVARFARPADRPEWARTALNLARGLPDPHLMAGALAEVAELAG
ncbi:hypothetical protein N8J89_23800 [Crossiella sp. CA-258035]|uniref:hypothetical protein n=1 Tax=Crossiella sp. CA-258035 TaxID=2981138 RepID=UPI0024BC4B9F|nr:hypothetical protein [Crossiella sp. CA-258035]WHT16154.1 hypothetical protein N8J89_23800 [Crossiella sp. CA-258035]